MVPLFIKVRPYVAERLGLVDVRFRTIDGNVLLCQADFIPFGPLSRLKDYVDKVGGVILQDKDAAAEEHDKNRVPARLPEPTSPDWAIPEGVSDPTDDITDVPTIEQPSEDPEPETTVEPDNGAEPETAGDNDANVDADSGTATDVIPETDRETED